MNYLIGNYVYFIGAGILSVLVLTAATSSYLQAVDYATTARGVDVYVMTPDQTIPANTLFTADIIITNDQTPLNAMEAEVLFDPSLFAVTDFTFGTTLCEERFIIDTVIDNLNGSLYVSCGTITPFTGNVTTFGTITVQSRQPGITNLTFGEKTQVYVHDGLGTEILRDKYATTIAIQSEV